VKDYETIITFAKSHGFIAENLAKHRRLVNPATGESVTIPITASDWRSILNTVADLRRIGLPIPHKAAKPKIKEKRGGNDSRLAEMMQVACGGFGIDLDNFVNYPHIDAILGQWRDGSWFDDDGNPLATEDWDYLTDQEVLAVIACTPAMVSPMPLALSAEAMTNRAPDRSIFLHSRAYKYWHVGDRIDLPEGSAVTACSCGKKFPTMFKLAEHVVHEQERCRLDHAPDNERLRPWCDPDDLLVLFGTDDQGVKIAELEAQLASANRAATTARSDLAHIKTEIRKLL
jgi:hypothetical protein